MEKLKYFMNRLGYTDEEITKLRNSHSLKELKEKTLIDNIYNNFTLFIKFGFLLNEIHIVTNKNPHILGYDVETLKDKIGYFLNNGLTLLQVKKIILKFPGILCLGKDNIEQKTIEFNFIGYTKRQILNMLSLAPKVFSLGIENIITTIDILSQNGYSLDEIINITSLYPSILCQSNELLKKKLYLYDFLGMKNYLSKYPKNYMQGIELSYARYMFLLERNEIINEADFAKVFCSSEIFEKYFKVSKEELLKMYPLDNLDQIQKRVIKKSERD